MNRTSQDFQHVLRVSAQVADELPGHVFIGGVAAYLHATNHERTRPMKESSHDSDFMISLSDFAALRDSQEITSNPRLRKHQLVFEGVELDVYVERQNSLVVPYDEVFARSVICDGLRIACVEHLLVLKLEAYGNRSGSSKGDKDERDIVTLACVCSGKIRGEVVAPFLRVEHVASMLKIAKGRVFSEMCSGNAHEAKKLWVIFDKLVRQISSMV
jgi:hypothetical protein